MKKGMALEGYIQEDRTVRPMKQYDDTKLREKIQANTDKIDNLDSRLKNIEVHGAPEANETKADKVTEATEGNLAGLDEEGNLTDSGYAPSDFAPATGSTEYAPASGSTNYAAANHNHDNDYAAKDHSHTGFLDTLFEITVSKEGSEYYFSTSPAVGDGLVSILNNGCAFVKIIYDDHMFLGSVCASFDSESDIVKVEFVIDNHLYQWSKNSVQGIIDAEEAISEDWSLSGDTIELTRTSNEYL